LLLNPKLLHGAKDEEPKQVKVFDDWDKLKEVISFPGKPMPLHSPPTLHFLFMFMNSKDSHSHLPADKVPLSITSPHIKTAIVCPPTIFGRGRGTGSQRSKQIPGLAALTLDRGAEIKIPAGVKAFWNNIHVYDLSRLYLLLIDAAADGGKGVTWGQEGYYLAENGVHCWQEVGGVDC
jgi:hypothetical protein